MSNALMALPWSVQRRLEFIEFRLFWEGGVNRADLIQMFGVSVPQASKDLALYQERAPRNAVYDRSAKRYVADSDFAPMFLNPDPGTYLSRLHALSDLLTDPGQSWIGHAPDADIAALPRRGVEPEVLRAVLAAIRESGSLEVHYQSMSRERTHSVWRRISPHALGYDGYRWHARGYCHIDEGFKDFVLTRILAVRSPGDGGAPATEDRHWNETFDIRIGPHPELTPGQQAVIAEDFGMIDGELVLSVRCAMLFYVLKRLGFLNDATKLSARTQQIVNLNRAETEFALEAAGIVL